MKKIYQKTLDYQKALQHLIHKKYPQLILGIFASYIILFYTYSLFLKNIRFNFALPKFYFNLSNKSKKVAPKKLTSQPNKPKTYIIQQGDDLWHIAEKFYGSGFNAYDISVANNINPSIPIVEGQKLIIPSVKPRQSTTGDTSSIQTSQVIYTEGKYVVQPGDSLSLISFKVYGDLYSWPKILQANNLQNPDLIEIGMVLNIPR